MPIKTSKTSQNNQDAGHDGIPDRSFMERIRKTISRNKLTHTAYNDFRKKIFTELSPEDSEIILYCLPWLLSVNLPECPGYIETPGYHFKVYAIEHHKEIRKREPGFKERFQIDQKGRLIKPHLKSISILGLYTIGSLGSAAQTSGSDCDIWVCIDKNEFDEAAWQCLNQKVNLIRDWMDARLKLPVYFFISDVSAIKACRFGRVGEESSGSAQQLVLKEEFYRTCMVICGKIPLWCLCWDKDLKFNYDQALEATNSEDYWEYDVIDFGDIQKIEKNEYFGAALWQFHKSLYRPLKSMIKMFLLKLLLDSTEASLLCHRFREKVLASKHFDNFPDPGVFTMTHILRVNSNIKQADMDFLTECLYIGCELNPYHRNQKLKNRLIRPFLKKYPISRERQTVLRHFNSWRFDSQIEFGQKLLKMLLKIYGEISTRHQGSISESDKKDLTILGRKISSFYLKKKYKIPILQKPTGSLNIPAITLVFKGGVWHLFSENEVGTPVVSHGNIIHVISFMVWNGLFDADTVRMRPNPSDITIKEIINLGCMIEKRFGTWDSQDFDYSNYLKDEHMVEILIIAGLERSPWYKTTMDFGAVYMNNWGEIYVRRFNSLEDFNTFIEQSVNISKKIETGYYIRRSLTGYEKIIARTKRILGHVSIKT